MRDLRDESAFTGEPVRWFAYTLALIFPWIALGITGPWGGMLVSLSAIGFWLWWIQPRVGLNRRPATWLATVLLIFLGAAVALIAMDQLQNPGMHS